MPPYQPPANAPTPAVDPRYAAQAAATTKERNRGCRIAALSGCAVLLVGVSIAGYLLYQAAKNSPFGDIASAVGEGVEVMQQARHAPGTDGMRKAGCNEAMAVNMSELRRITKHLDASTPDLSQGVGGVRSMVICSMGIWARTQQQQTCDKIARAYLHDGGQPAGQFVVTVNKSGNKKPVCTAQYDEAGKHLGSLQIE